MSKSCDITGCPWALSKSSVDAAMRYVMYSWVAAACSKYAWLVSHVYVLLLGTVSESQWLNH